MTKLREYLHSLKSKGRSLTEINPGSDDVAIRANEALKAIVSLKDNDTAILGGDILSIDSGNLTYAHQLWGSEYHYLNWYCDRLEGEETADFSKRSYELAERAIKDAIKISDKLGKECLVVLII